ncbi:MAG: CPBP family intramembrane glutamic endopeptidase [Pseudomonadota bacterium]
MPNYPLHEGFIAPARRRPQIWRLLLGTVIAFAIYMLGVFAIVGVAWRQLGAGEVSLETVVAADEPQTLLILLTTFIGMAVGPMVAVRLLHNRSAASLFGRAPLVLRDFVVATVAVGGLFSISVLGWFTLYDALPGMPLADWLWILPAALLCVLIQTGAEEVLFRGYFQQQLAARFATPLVWIVIPSVAFGMVHYNAASAGTTVWIVVLSASLFGFIAADLTAHTGSIGAAWGFHFANNVIALLIIGTQGSLTGLALFRTPYAISETDVIWPLILVDLAFMLLAWLLVRRLIRR